MLSSVVFPFLPKALLIFPRTWFRRCARSSSSSNGCIRPRMVSRSHLLSLQFLLVLLLCGGLHCYLGSCRGLPRGVSLCLPVLTFLRLCSVRHPLVGRWTDCVRCLISVFFLSRFRRVFPWGCAMGWGRRFPVPCDPMLLVTCSLP